MHLMTAAILQNRMLTACSTLAMMNADLPEDLPVHQSHGSGLGLLGLQRDHFPEGICSSLYPLQLQLEKPLGLCLPEGKVSHPCRCIFCWTGAAQHHSSQHRQPPQPPGPSWGSTPSSGEGHPSCEKISFRAFFSLPTAGGCCTQEQGLYFGWLGRCAGTKVTTKLCPAWPSMNEFANVEL